MEILVWGGALISLLGLVGLMWSIARVHQARRAKLPDDQLREAVQKALPINLGALCLSVLGLMGVILGVFLS
ncbi:MAG: hypothetical protein ACU0DK_05365 [Pseudooceanicola sp.]